MQELFQSKDPHNFKIGPRNQNPSTDFSEREIALGVVVVCEEWWELAYEKIVLGLQV